MQLAWNTEPGHEDSEQSYPPGPIGHSFESLRARHSAKNDRPMVTFEHARANATPIDWTGYQPPRPHLLLQQDHAVSTVVGTRVTQHVRVLRDVDLTVLRRYIDWQPFFNAWEMKGAFPDILNNPNSGPAARKLYDDAQAMLDQMVEEKWIRAHGVVGLFPASSVGDDVEVYLDEERTDVHATLHHLRQQGQHRDGVPNRSLADYVAPKDSGLRDHVGAFAVTAGDGVTERGEAFRKDLDDYNAILLESLADRLAEAFAERLHERVRKEIWGYAPDEHLDSVGLIKEQYDGIRPAPGYPACPEHTEKQTLWELLDVEKHTGIALTESMAMWPGASVSGFYYSHPQSQYFVVGRLGRDQVADYAERKGWTLTEAERWLSPNLGYDPED